MASEIECLIKIFATKDFAEFQSEVTSENSEVFINWNYFSFGSLIICPFEGRQELGTELQSDI